MKATRYCEFHGLGYCSSTELFGVTTTDYNLFRDLSNKFCTNDASLLGVRIDNNSGRPLSHSTTQRPQADYGWESFRPLTQTPNKEPKENLTKGCWPPSGHHRPWQLVPLDCSSEVLRADPGQLLVSSSGRSDHKSHFRDLWATGDFFQLSDPVGSSSLSNLPLHRGFTSQHPWF